MPIDLRKLTESDKGRKVLYHPHGGPVEIGVITEWNERDIFVSFDEEKDSKATSPCHLMFLHEEPVCQPEPTEPS